MVDLYMPSSIPDPSNDSLEFAPYGEDVLRSTMGAGTKTRPARTNSLETFRCQLYLEPAQLKTLMDFYNISARRVLPFYWWDWRWPGDGQHYATYKFMARPSYAKWEDMWRVDVNFLIVASYEGQFLLDFYDSNNWPTT
ncbi:hypothetical protein [Stenotrophomonas sp. ESTM1D_MKCIP4_1]|uniref:hypothetical protein n=1 Tax=Stenotrophomonas sp. ESTM1D_MKCIP4_1 TaxID=2072414 RepID=UPI00131F05A3|nr:hypothetical protein [Stenotrophomonas sp. ESTM1D_MKCIP4_1]